MRFVTPHRLLGVLFGLVVAAAAAGCGSSATPTVTTVTTGGTTVTTTSTAPATTTTTTTSAPQSLPSIHFSYPAGWTQLPRSRWSAVGAPSTAAAVIERHGNSANLVVLRGPQTTVTNKTARKINNRLKKQYSDYQFISAQKIKLPNGGGQPIHAMLFSYARAKQGVFHTITLIPAGKISFVVYTASPPKSKVIAREISKILKSARLTFPQK